MAEDEDGSFRWGLQNQCGKEGARDGCFISTHPMQRSTAEKVCSIRTCEGFAAFAGSLGFIPTGTAGCFESQCEFHDNQAWWTDFHPGTCMHCPAGYTDYGLTCIKWWGPFPIFRGHHYYGLDYAIPRTDAGLVEKMR
jgi:hypothetical protein